MVASELSSSRANCLPSRGCPAGQHQSRSVQQGQISRPAMSNESVVTESSVSAAVVRVPAALSFQEVEQRSGARSAPLWAGPSSRSVNDVSLIAGQREGRQFCLSLRHNAGPIAIETDELQLRRQLRTQVLLCQQHLHR